jgi:HK97 family phage prohead protease
MAEIHAPFQAELTLPTVKSINEEDGDLIIEGFAADWEKDRQGEKFLPQAFDEAVKKAQDGGIPLLLEHNNNQPLGLVEKLEVRPGEGLWTRARIMAKSVSDAWDGAKGKIDLIRRGVMKGLSVRGHSWGRMTADGPEIGHIDLAEISVTPVGAQPGALFRVVQKSIDFAKEEIAAAAAGYEDLRSSYSDQEIADAVEAVYKDRIKRAKAELKAIQARLD